MTHGDRCTSLALQVVVCEWQRWVVGRRGMEVQEAWRGGQMCRSRGGSGGIQAEAICHHSN